MALASLLRICEVHRAVCSSSRCDHTAAYHFPLGTIWVASLLCLMVNGAAMNPTPLCKSLSESPWGRTRVPGDADPQRAQVPSHKLLLPPSWKLVPQFCTFGGQVVLVILEGLIRLPVFRWSGSLDSVSAVWIFTVCREG